MLPQEQYALTPPLYLLTGGGSGSGMSIHVVLICILQAPLTIRGSSDTADTMGITMGTLLGIPTQGVRHALSVSSVFTLFFVIFSYPC